MCVYMHSRFVKNHPIQILEDGHLISEGVLSQEEALTEVRWRRGADVLVRRRPWSRRWRRGARPVVTQDPTADARHRSGGEEALVVGALFV
jgi:hypothetical protein